MTYFLSLRLYPSRSRSDGSMLLLFFAMVVVQAGRQTFGQASRQLSRHSSRLASNGVGRKAGRNGGVV